MTRFEAGRHALARRGGTRSRPAPRWGERVPAPALAVVGYVLVELRVVVLPVIAGLFFATLLVSPARWLARRGCGVV